MARQYTSAFKHQLIEAFFTSDLTLKTFASQIGIPYDTLRAWLAKDARYKTHTPSSDNGLFLPINISTNKLNLKENIILIYPNGVKIELPQNADISTISSLIKAY